MKRGAQMLLRYELRRAFGIMYVIALLISIASGIGGILAYYYDTMWSDLRSISCYDAWLYCLSVSEGSIYRAVFPILISLPYLSTYHSDRKSRFIYFVLTRGKYRKYFLTKLFVGIISATAVIIPSLFTWLGVSWLCFPHNLPDTIYNYVPGGAFSRSFINQPMKYIQIIILLNAVAAVLYYLVAMIISFSAKNKYQVILLPFLIYLSLIIISQFNFFSSLNPVVLVSPLETSWCTETQIMTRIVLLVIFTGIGLFVVYSKDKMGNNQE